VRARNFAIVSLDELERYPTMSGAPVLMPARRCLDVRAFGVHCWTAPVGAPGYRASVGTLLVAASWGFTGLAAVAWKRWLEER
jgi:hypothetical protein